MNSFACSSPSPAMLVELSRRMKVLRPCPIESEHSVAVDKSWVFFIQTTPFIQIFFFFFILKFDVFRILVNHQDLPLRLSYSINWVKSPLPPL